METIHHTIVVLHATTEDVVRTIARWRLPLCNAEALKDIPIARPDSIGEARLKELGQLVPNQGMTVEELIWNSINTWLDRQTFNSAQQVAIMLQKIGVSIEGVRARFATIDQIAGLRHQIAHTGDLCEKDLNSLLAGPELTHFILDIYLFARTLLLDIVPKEHLMRFQVEVLLQEELNRRKGLDAPTDIRKA